MRLTRYALATAALAASVALSAPAAFAGPQPCAATSATPLFSAWGDQSLYSPFKGGTFEQGDQGWSWYGGALVIAGDDDHLLTGSGSHAVQIPSGATALSPHLCVDSTMPSMRFFIRRVSGTGNLTVTGTVDGAARLATTIAVVSGGASWAPSPAVVFPSILADAIGTGSLTAQFRFTADPGSVFRIDDVAMDPYRRT